MYTVGSMWRPLTILLQLFLCSSFFFLFGLPAIQRFAEKKVLVLESTRDAAASSAPTITVVAASPQTKYGWLDPTLSYMPAEDSVIERQCGQTTTTIEQCIRQKTFSRGDLLVKVDIGFPVHKSMEGNGVWRTGWSNSYYGRTYTIDFSWNSTGHEYDQINFFLNYNLEHKIFIHDRDYFLANENPFGLPSMFLTINPNKSFNYYERLAVTEHRELDSPGDPCREEPNYSFRHCVRENINRSTDTVAACVC